MNFDLLDSQNHTLCGVLYNFFPKTLQWQTIFKVEVRKFICFLSFFLFVSHHLPSGYATRVFSRLIVFFLKYMILFINLMFITVILLIDNELMLLDASNYVCVMFNSHHKSRKNYSEIRNI